MHFTVLIELIPYLNKDIIVINENFHQFFINSR